MERTRLEIGTSQARKWHKPGSNQARTRFENGTNKARKWHETGTEKARKILQFVSFMLEARHAKWLELRHDRRIDVTQMTGNSVRKARCLNKQRLVVPKILLIGQGTKILQPKISSGWQIDSLPHLCLLGLICRDLRSPAQYLEILPTCLYQGFNLRMHLISKAIADLYRICMKSIDLTKIKK